MKPLLYKDKIASAPTQKHLSEVLSGGGEEDFQSCKMSFFTQIISVQPNLPQGKARVLLKIIGLGIGYPSDTDHSAVHGVQWSLDKVKTLIRYMCLYYRVSVTFDAAPTCLSQMCVLHMSHYMPAQVHSAPCTELAPVQISQVPPLPLPCACIHNVSPQCTNQPARQR